MIRYHNHIIIVAAIFSYFAIPLNIHAKELIVPVNNMEDIIKVEIGSTNLARPADIQINKFKNNLEVTGVIKRIGHKNLRIRGHVDVDLVSIDGDKIESQLFALKPLNGSAKHDRQRKFSIILAVPKLSDYRLKVRHHIGMNDHK